MSFVATRVLKIWSWLMILVIITGLGIPTYLLPPRYVLDPQAASFNHETKRITLVRDTRMSKQFDFISTYAGYEVEATILREEPHTCPGPTGEAPYENLTDNTTTIPAAWLMECIGPYDTVYRVAYSPIIEINRGPLAGLRFHLPRHVAFQTIFPARVGILEKEVEQLQDGPPLGATYGGR